MRDLCGSDMVVVVLSSLKARHGRMTDPSPDGLNVLFRWRSRRGEFEGLSQKRLRSRDLEEEA